MHFVSDNGDKPNVPTRQTSWFRHIDSEATFQSLPRSLAPTGFSLCWHRNVLLFFSVDLCLDLYIIVWQGIVVKRRMLTESVLSIGFTD